MTDSVIEKVERRDEDAVDDHGRVDTCKRKDGSGVGVGLPGPTVPNGPEGDRAGAFAFLFRPSGRSRQPHPSSYRR